MIFRLGVGVKVGFTMVKYAVSLDKQERLFIEMPRVCLQNRRRAPEEFRKNPQHKRKIAFL